MAKAQWAETGVGALVILVSAGFLAYSLTVGGRGRPHGYEVKARFGQAGALAPGAAVSVAGVKIGTVTSITLDPKTYMAMAKLDLDPAVPLPSDSTAKITSDGIMGGAHVVIEPGGASDNLKPGAEIENTQGAVDMLGMVGQYLRPQGGGGAPQAGGGAATATPAPPAPAHPGA